MTVPTTSLHPANDDRRLEGLSVEEKRALLKRLLEERAQAERGPALVRRAAREAPCSFAQERLWFVEQLAPGYATYNLIIGVRARGRVDRDALDRAYRWLLARHAPLRTGFRATERGPVAFVAEVAVPPIPLRDLSGLPEHARIGAAREVAWRDANTGFDLRRPPVIRAQLLRLAERDHVLLFTMHHIAVDGWSAYVLLSDLTAAYAAFRRGAEPERLPLAVEYGDYAAWQRDYVRGSRGQRELDFWRRKFADLPPPLDLVGDFPRPDAPSATDGGRESFKFEAPLASRIRDFSREQGATLFMVLLAGHQVLMSRYSTSRDIVTAITSANRSQPELEPLIGCFVNTLPIRVDLRGNPTFREVVRRVRAETLAAYSHREAPFEQIVRAVAPDRGVGQMPLFENVFTMNNTPRVPLVVESLELTQFLTRNASSKVDLAMEIQEGGYGEDFPAASDELIAALSYRTSLFTRDSMRKMAARYRSLFERVCVRADVRIEDLDLRLSEEMSPRTSVATAASEPGTVLDAIEAVATSDPTRVALRDGPERLTYGELYERSGRLARALWESGVRSGDTVGVAARPSAEALVSIVGVMRVGASYLPLMEGEPLQRARIILDRASATVVVTSGDLDPSLGRSRVTPTSVPLDPRAALPVVAPSAAAYVITTSGSSGTPKGVVIEHRQLKAYAEAMIERLGLTSDDRVLFEGNLAFDLSVFEMFSALHAGAGVVVHDNRGSVAELLRKLAGESVSIASMPTSLFHVVADSLGPGDWPRAVRVLFTGGEKMSRRSLDRFMRVSGAGTTVVNAYGPTETTVSATTFGGTPEAARALGGNRDVPIGRAHRRSVVHVGSLDGRPIAQGLPGEICVGGDIVGRGYLHDPRLTAERFVPDGFTGRPGARVYRTGDVGRVSAEGEIEFLGRVDAQIKLRGFRIELDEIALALRSIPGVADAALALRGAGAQAWIAAWVAGRDMAFEGLEEKARARLPAHMVPQRFCRVPRIERTTGGKVRFASLPEPTSHAPRPISRATTDTENELARIFGELIGNDDVDVEADFFELGGHSLMATQLVARIRQVMSIEIDVRDVFELRHVRAIAARLDEAALGVGRAQLEPPTRLAHHGPIALSAAQERIWRREQVHGELRLNHIAMIVRVSGALSVPVLERTFTTIVERHEVLRTRYEERDGEPVQIVDEPAPVRIEVTALPERDAVLGWARAQADAPLDLLMGRVFRASVARISATEHVLALVVHHLASDGWSLDVWLREVSEIYEAYCAGVGCPLPPLPVQYSDFAAFERSPGVVAMHDRQLGYWKTALHGLAPRLDLVGIAPARRPDEATLVERPLDAAACERLIAVGRELRASPYVSFAAAFAALLSDASARDDIAFASAIARRRFRELEPLIGCFVDLVALRVRVASTTTACELIAAVREAVLGATAHQDVPFKRVAEALGALDRGHHPLVQHRFKYGRYRPGATRSTSLTLEPVDGGAHRAKYELDVNVGFEPDGGYHVAAISRFEPEALVRLMERFEVLIARLGDRPDAPIASVSGGS